MGLIDEPRAVTRRLMNLIYVIDKSGSMSGGKIQSVNDAIENLIPMVQEISENNPDAEVKISALQFSDDAEWTYDEPRSPEDFSWIPIVAGGMTSLGAACRLLEKNLHRENGFMNSKAGYLAPVIILMSDGGPNDDFEGGLAVLKKNSWFKHAIKIAIAIGEDADKDVLAEFTGSLESVVVVHNLDALKTMIRAVTITSTQIGSSTNTSTGNDKQSQTENSIKKIVDNTSGASVATDADGEEDNW